VAVQFSLSYDANGDPVLVENTVTGTRKVISRSPVVSEYKSRFETPASGDPITDAEESQPESNQSAIMDYIMEMEKGADADPNLSFIQKQNLEGYTPDAIEASKKEPTTTQKVMGTILKALIPYGNAASAAVKALGAILPEESEEIKAIKQFYADPEQAALVESIPGMSDYNLVYGNPFDPSYGLANAAQRRIDTINKSLAKFDKYDPNSPLFDKKKYDYQVNKLNNLTKLVDKENKEKEEIRQRQINPVQNLTPQQKDFFRNGGGGQDSGNQSSGSPTGTNRPGGPDRPDDAGQRDAGPGFTGGGTAAEMGSF